MVNKPLIRPYFWGGYVRGGGTLTSHEDNEKWAAPTKLHFEISLNGTLLDNFQQTTSGVIYHGTHLDSGRIKHSAKMLDHFESF